MERKEQKMEIINKEGIKTANTKKLVILAFLSAVSYVLMLLHFPIKYLGFLEIELSNVPAMIAGFVFGPVAGVVVVLIKNLLSAMTRTSTGGIGELANFVINSSYVFTAIILMRNLKGKYRYIISYGVAVVLYMVVGAISNYYVLVPLYAKLFGGVDKIINTAKGTIPIINDIASLVIIGITPFNLVMGVLISYTSYYVYKRIGGQIS